MLQRSTAVVVEAAQWAPNDDQQNARLDFGHYLLTLLLELMSNSCQQWIHMEEGQARGLAGCYLSTFCVEQLLQRVQWQVGHISVLMLI
jgi:hypothetical protein